MLTKFIHAKEKSEIVFTSGATDGLNRIVFGYFRYHLKAGDEVLLRCIQQNQKSNMWVVSAKVSYEDFEDRTIFSNINAIFNLNENIKLLKKWMDIISKEGG